jgi:hypothetical protein
MGYGSCNRKGLLKNIEYSEYFTTDRGGNYNNHTETYNQYFTTPNYDYPAPIAVQWAGGPGWVENNISIKIGNATFVF